MRFCFSFFLIVFSGNHLFSQIEFSLSQKDSNSIELNIQNFQKRSVFIVVSCFLNEFTTNELANDAGNIRIDFLKEDEYIDPQVRPIKTLEITGETAKSIMITGRKENFISLILKYYVVPNKKRINFIRLVRKSRWRKINKAYEIKQVIISKTPHKTQVP